MPFYFFAWIGAITSGFIVITAKLTSKHSIANPWLFNFLLTAVTLLFTVPIALFNNASFPSDWMPIIIAAIFSVLFNIFWIFSTYNLDVSTLTPLFNIRAVFAVLIGIIFFSEKFTLYQLLIMLGILIAGVFSTMDEKFSVKSFFKPAIGIAVLTMLFLTLNNTFIKLSLVRNSLWTTNLWIAIINMILLAPTVGLFKKDLKMLNLSHILPIGAMGVFSTITEFSANVAYGMNLSVTSIIMNTPFSMIFAFLFSIFAPKLLEKHTLKIYAIRFSAEILMILGAMQLSR